MIPEHLNELVQCALSHQPQGAVGRQLQNWARNFVAHETHSHILDQLPAERVSRGSLKAFCQNPDGCSEARFCAIMAWGGMRTDHARRAWSSHQRWTSVLDGLRSPAMSRGAAYHTLKESRIKGDLPGLRPAFFTKLLFFIRPLNDAYIMDQWTAKSVNLLFGHEVVLINRDGFISDDNSPDHYESFCKCIEKAAEAVSAKIGETVSGEKMEEIMMSKGGRPPGEWRLHVKTHWIWQ